MGMAVETAQKLAQNLCLVFLENIYLQNKISQKYSHGSLKFEKMPFLSLLVPKLKLHW